MTSAPPLRVFHGCAREGSVLRSFLPELPGLRPRLFSSRHGGPRMLDIDSPLVLVMLAVLFIVCCAIAVVAAVVWLPVLIEAVNPMR